MSEVLVAVGWATVRTSNVMAMANTPSLKASTRDLFTAADPSPHSLDGVAPTPTWSASDHRGECENPRLQSPSSRNWMEDGSRCPTTTSGSWRSRHLSFRS